MSDTKNMTNYQKYKLNLLKKLGSEEAVNKKLASDRKARRDAKKSVINDAKNSKDINELKQKLNIYLEQSIKNNIDITDIEKKYKKTITQFNQCNNEEKIKNLISKKSNLSPITVEKNLQKLNFLYKSIYKNKWDFTDYNWLKNFDAITTFIEHHYSKPSTISNSFNSIIFTINKFEDFDKELIDSYIEKSVKYKKMYDEERSQNKLNEKQRKKLISYTELCKFDVPENIQDRLLYQLFIQLPRRPAAYARLIYLEKDDGVNNSLTIINDKLVMNLNMYKTVKSYGKIQINLPEYLLSIFKKHISTNKLKYGEPVFLHNKRDAYKLSNFTKYIKKVFFTQTGKDLTATDIRVIYISSIDFNKSSRFELDKKAKMLGHCFSQMRLYHKIDIN